LLARPRWPTIRVLEDEEVLRHVQGLGPILQTRLHDLQQRLGTLIRDADSVGLLGRIELAACGVLSPTAVTSEVIKRMRDDGVIGRAAGPVVTLSPLLVISERDLARILDVLETAVHAVTDGVA
jgi:adenosylmethionine-8-amino-7-oxononanoate aminotransferase